MTTETSAQLKQRINDVVAPGVGSRTVDLNRIITNLVDSGVTHQAGPEASFNTGIGASALAVADTGSLLNVAIGQEALMSHTTGFQNVAIGVSAIKSGVALNNNVAIGAAALTLHTSGDHTTAVGSLAMPSHTAGADNTALGYHSMGVATTGATNTAVGSKSAETLTQGSNNVAVGYLAAGTVLTTGTGNTVVGQGATVSAAAAVDQIVLGRAVVGVANSSCTIGAGATNKVSIALDGVTTSWTAASDERLKTNVEDYQAGLSFISSLRPVTYEWRARKDVSPDLSLYSFGDPDEPCNGQGRRYSGFLAQEVKSVIDAHPDVPDGQHLWSDLGGVQALAPSELIPILVNAVKELAAEVYALKAAKQ